MTQNKNKKGIAKKALSISLVAAMLATSNVPVWASGFEAVDPEVEGFALEESVAEEPVDSFEESDATQAQVTRAHTDIALTENGWASYVGVTGAVYDAAGDATTNYDYSWYVDGYEVATGKGTDKKISKYVPGADAIGKELTLRIYSLNNANENDNIDVTLSAGTVSKQRIDINDKNGDSITLSNEMIGYNGNWYYTGSECKILPAEVTVTFNNKGTLKYTNGDFKVTFESEANDFINAGSEVTMVVTPADTDLYTGRIDKTYRIDPRVYQTGDIYTKLVDAKKTYEYTGDYLLPALEDIGVYDALKTPDELQDSNKVIEKLWNDAEGKATTVGVHDYAIALTNMSNYTEDSLPGYDEKALVGRYTVVNRNLDNCTAEIDPIGYADNDVITSNDAAFKGKVHIYDENGNELNLKYGTDYEVVVAKNIPSKEGTYAVTIKANKNTTGDIDTTFDITGKVFDGFKFKNDKVVRAAVDYTGEAITKDIAAFGDFLDAEKKAVSTEDYTVRVEGLDAGTNAGKVIVEGKRTYAGAKLVIPFTINAAVVDSTAVVGKVVYNKGYKTAAEYAPAVTVKANSKTPTKPQFTLTEDDYTVRYSFVNTVNQTNENSIGNHITTIIDITNKNFKGGQTHFELTNGTLIARRQMSDCKVEVVPSTYTYTGAVIEPELVVTDADGQELTKDVDYVIKEVKNGVNVGTATVVIAGKDTNEEGNGIYDPTSVATANFQITAANAEDVVVEFAKDNTGTTYTGKNLKPTVLKITLNGNDVSNQFDIVYPNNNINVGKGYVTLKPVVNNKNFVGTKKAEFDIVARELYGTLKVYDENGKAYTVGADGYLYDANNKKIAFDYDGKEHTFKAQFTPNSTKMGSYAKLVTENDYEITYVDNVFGLTSYICVVGKGNFAGTEKITDANNEIVNSVVAGTAYKFDINKYELKKQHVTFGDAEYAAGAGAKPQVTVEVLGRTLTEGKDYELVYSPQDTLTNGKTLSVTVKGIGAFIGSVEGKYAIVKRNMANCDITAKNGVVTVKNGNIVVPSSEYTVSRDANGNYVVTAKADSKFYTGTGIAPGVNTPADTTLKVTDRTTSTVSLAWDEVDGAEGYTIWFRSEYDTKVSRKIIQGGDVTSWKQNGLQPGTKYFYTIRAWVKDNEGNYVFGEQSPVQRGTTKPVAAAIKTVSADNGYVKVVLAGKAAGAKMYSMCYSKSMNGFDSNDFKVGIRTSYTTRTFTKALSAGTYYVRVKSYRDLGNNKRVYGAWSNTVKVVVK